MKKNPEKSNKSLSKSWECITQLKKENQEFIKLFLSTKIFSKFMEESYHIYKDDVKYLIENSHEEISYKQYNKISAKLTQLSFPKILYLNKCLQKYQLIIQSSPNINTKFSISKILCQNLLELSNTVRTPNKKPCFDTLSRSERNLHINLTPIRSSINIARKTMSGIKNIKKKFKSNRSMTAADNQLLFTFNQFQKSIRLSNRTTTNSVSARKSSLKKNMKKGKFVNKKSEQIFEVIEEQDDNIVYPIRRSKSKFISKTKSMVKHLKSKKETSVDNKNIRNYEVLKKNSSEIFNYRTVGRNLCMAHNKSHKVLNNKGDDEPELFLN